MPDGYSQIFKSYVFGPSGFWTMAPLRYAGKCIFVKYKVHQILSSQRIDETSEQDERGVPLWLCASSRYNLYIPTREPQISPLSSYVHTSHLSLLWLVSNDRGGFPV